MSESENNDSQWEGFEQFCDQGAPPSPIPKTQIAQPYIKKQEKQLEATKKQQKRQKQDIKNEHPEQIQTTEKDLKPTSPVATKIQEKISTKLQMRRYQRIPIIRYEEDCRYAGRVIYKNFVPRTSDNYFRILKEVDWQLSVQKKRDIRNLHGIQFNSQFESGNLNLAIQYDLYMRVDSNTSGHRQWFYFSMKNQRKCKVRLNIYRFKKPYSLFQRGMKPYVRSRKGGRQWQPGCENIQYCYERQRNDYGVKKEMKSFVLTLSYTFQHQNDQVFIAAGIPYSYTFLNKQISNYKTAIEARGCLSIEISQIGKSMCGLEITLLTVENILSKQLNTGKRKRIIIINARTHSGEASSSWVLDGILLELRQSEEVQEWLLRENICLKIIPMLNPDGVFIGNYRTGIIGDDFNRKFNSGRREFYPEIYALKRVIAQSKREGAVELFLDLHGHSILKNSFIYGPPEAVFTKFKMKSLPYLLPHCSKYFRLRSCKFRAQKENIQTARVFFQVREQILTFTCQNSLGLYGYQNQTMQMLSHDWQQFGQSILRAMVRSFGSSSLQVLPKIVASSPEKQKNNISMRSNFSSQIERTSKPINPVQISKTSKKNKINFRNLKPNSTIFFAENQQFNNNSFAFSHQLTPKNQTLQIKQFSYHNKYSNQNPKDIGIGRPNLRRKSQVMKVPPINFSQHKALRNSQKKCQEDSNWVFLGRSSTYDTSETLKREIEFANRRQQVQDDREQMQSIDQNFSDDYASINDQDSSNDDLPEQEKKNLFDYIKSNQQKGQTYEQDDLLSYEKDEKGKYGSKVTRFRQLHFKSIDQICSVEANKETVRTNQKKIKLQPHKFKQSTAKSLISKYNQMLANTDLIQPNLVTFSQQKQLNDRNLLRRGQKDPFILIQRKQKPINQ